MTTAIQLWTPPPPEPPQDPRLFVRWLLACIRRAFQ